MNFNENIEWHSQVRMTIQRFSSDSTTYKGTNDYFYSVDGIGKGHWGLREFEPNNANVDLTEDDSGFAEGKLKLRQHVYRERNHKVIMIAKELHKSKYGKLSCQVCGFNFEEVYGDIGSDYIEGHHIIPISKLSKIRNTKVEEIVLVCSNCHRMLHRRRPWLTINQLNKLLLNN